LSEENVFLNALRDWMEAAMQRSFHAFIRHNRESNLSFSQVNALFRLYHHGGSSVNDLANHLGITMAAVSQLLVPLIAAGLVLRSENPVDRRKKLIALTEMGKDQVKKSMNIRHAWLSELSQILSDSEKEKLLPAIKLLNQRTRELKVEGKRPCVSDP
jgi:DNA-binding MarR family transcriptional regulator